jgi:hypothetical protein
MLEIARSHFGTEPFERRKLMELTELKVRIQGLWEREDDHLSGSSNPKSRGLANIDYRFSFDLAYKKLTPVRRGVWRVKN